MTSNSWRAALCITLAFVAVGCARGAHVSVEPTPPTEVAALTGQGDASASDPPASRWATLLRRLDVRRGRAFTRGAPSLLDRVYAPGSAVRRADARLLRSYRHRGLELESVRFRLEAVDIVRGAEREATLRVVDRLRPVRVRAGHGPWRSLPRDLPTERIIILRRLDAGWRIAGIRRVAG